MQTYTITYTQNNTRYREKIIAARFAFEIYPPLPDDKMYVFYDDNEKLVRGGMMLISENTIIENVE